MDVQRIVHNLLTPTLVDKLIELGEPEKRHMFWSLAHAMSNEIRCTDDSSCKYCYLAEELLRSYSYLRTHMPKPKLPIIHHRKPVFRLNGYKNT